MDDIKTKIKNSDYFIIAEIGMNHDGSLGNAFKLIEEAKRAGVDAVKFQLHIAESLLLKSAPTHPYFILEDRHEYYKRTSFSIDEWKKLRNYANESDLFFIVSPFSHKAVDILEEVDIDAYKIASGETTNLPLLSYINSKKKPILLSTGMSNWKEIESAIKQIEENLIVLFQCTSKYPCPPKNVGLNIIKELIQRYKDMIIGYSDHTINNSSSIGAYINGAKVFEKHFTLSKKIYGPDARHSLEPEEMKVYIEGIDFISIVLKNSINKDDIELFNEAKSRYEKSICASKELLKGHILEYQDLYFKRPGDGIRADRYKELIGRTLKIDLKKDDKILFEHLK